MHGLGRPDEEEARRLANRPIGLFDRGPGAGPREPRRLLSGTCDGRRVDVFDVKDDVSGGSAHGGAVASWYTAAAAILPARVDGRLALLRRGLMRNPRGPDMPEVDEGLPHGVLFGFRVYSTNRAIVDAIVDDDLRHWLLRDGRGFHHEVVHDLAVSYTRRRRRPGARANVIEAALGFADRVSAGLTRR